MGLREKKWTLNELVEGKHWMQQQEGENHVGLDRSGRGPVNPGINDQLINHLKLIIYA